MSGLTVCSLVYMFKGLYGWHLHLRWGCDVGSNSISAMALYTLEQMVVDSEQAAYGGPDEAGGWT